MLNSGKNGSSNYNKIPNPCKPFLIRLVLERIKNKELRIKKKELRIKNKE